MIISAVKMLLLCVMLVLAMSGPILSTVENEMNPQQCWKFKEKLRRKNHHISMLENEIEGEFNMFLFRLVMAGCNCFKVFS